MINSDTAAAPLTSGPANAMSKLRPYPTKDRLSSIRTPNAPTTQSCGGTPSSSIAARCPPSWMREANKQDIASPSGFHSKSAVTNAGNNKLTRQRMPHNRHSSISLQRQ